MARSEQAPHGQSADGALEWFAKNMQKEQQPGGELAGLFARGENYRHIRHARLLERWPVIDEPWAGKVETTRIAAIDRTPGSASFGR